MQQRLRQEMERLEGCIRAVTLRLEREDAGGLAISGPPLNPGGERALTKAVSPVGPPPIPTEGRSPLPVPLPPPPKIEVRENALRARDSWELQLGTVWLVRIGIVVLLTGLVFLGNFAYQTFVGKLGPGGRLALLYLAGAGLCGAGAWIERGKEALRNYSRVLMGGGVATIYYATYAAYFVQALKVLGDPLVAGAILLALTLGIAWLADRKRSEILATFAILLSFYTGTINPIAEFTLFSHLLLSALAVGFLVRRQWTTLSFLSLAAAYISFDFWHFFHHGALPWDFVAKRQFWPGISMLTCYWVLFTTGLFLCANVPARKRMAFLSINNGAYFALATMLIRGAWPAFYWTFPCGLGVTCLGLAWLAQRKMRDQLLVDGAYLAQGLLLVTLGFAMKLTGYQFALVLALEGTVLVTCCRQRHAWVYKAGAILVSATAFFSGVSRVTQEAWTALPVGGTLALFFLFNARWSKRLQRSATGGVTASEVQPFAAFFVVLALVFGALIVDIRVAVEWRYPVMAIVTLFFAFAVSLHGLLELAILGQVYLLWAGASWLVNDPAPPQPLPWWNPALLVGAAVAMVHWWKGQTVSRQRLGILGQTVGALAVVALLNQWLAQSIPGNRLLVVLPLLAIGLLGYGIFTQTLALKIASQLFVVLVAGLYVQALAEVQPPPAVLAILAFIGVFLNGMAVRWTFENSIWFDGSPALEPAGVPLLEAYRFLAMGLYVMWGFAYVPERWWFAFFAFSALGLLGAGVWSHRPWRIRRCALLLLLALGVFWNGDEGQISTPNAAAMLTLLAVYHIAKRPALNWPGLPERWRDTIAYILLATLWLLVTRWVRMEGHGFYTTIAWSVLAASVLGCGFLLRDRSHRRAGMVLFGLALARILLIDVWNLETGYRIASFLVLGLLLPLLGFVYNRFADRIRTLE